MKHRAQKRLWQRILSPFTAAGRFFSRITAWRLRIPRLIRRSVLVLVLTAIVGAAGTTVVAYAFDRVDSDHVLPGITVGGVDIGGMRRYQAIHAVRAKLEPSLHRTLVVHVGHRTLRVVPADLGVHALVSPAVNQALIESQSMTWVSRSYHRLFGWSVSSSIPVSYAYPSDRITPLIAAAAKSIDAKPTNAYLGASASDMSILPSHAKTGRHLDQTTAVALVLKALQTRASSVKIPVQVVQPKVTDAKLGRTITVDLSNNTLQLYDGFHVIRTYPVATAITPYSTPIGTWHVVQKEPAPVWINPGTPWAASMPPMIPAGPSNPLGLRALALDAPGVLIHGTPEDSSVGHWASHGCIRMHESDAIALYPLVPVDTKVIIFGAPPWGASSVAGQYTGF